MIEATVVKAVVKGLFTYVPGYDRLQYQKKKKSKHSASNALFCYTFWLGLLKYLHTNQAEVSMDVVGELGTAGSLGLGLCALLTGAKKYYALEIEVLYDVNRNLILLDELVDLFKCNAPLSVEFSQINLPINDFTFPNQLVEQKYLDEEFVQCLRNDLQSLLHGKTENIFLVKDWSKINTARFGFIFSRAVMEHVNNPMRVYRGIHSILVPDGYMLHDIELHSHGVTEQANGHLNIPNLLWRLIEGNRKYFLNRVTHEGHLNAIQNYFSVVSHFTKKAGSLGFEQYLGCVVLAQK
jgi:SAM-dependent methyltransferase